MTEKINGQGFRPTDTAGTKRSEAAKPAAGGATGKSASVPVSTGDTVNITRSGLLLAKLEEVVQSVPIVDADRVAAAKNALSSGQYEIDDRRIADRLLGLERERSA